MIHTAISTTRQSTCHYLYHYLCHYSQGEVEACFKGIAADQRMILQLRERGEAAEGRANNVLTAMERWRLPMLYMKVYNLITILF
jgi:hypothetical protein